MLSLNFKRSRQEIMADCWKMIFIFSLIALIEILVAITLTLLNIPLK